MFLTCLLANVHESDLDTPRDDALDGVRHRDATRIGESLQSRGDVDPVAVDRAVGLLDHVADVNAKAEAHAPVIRNVSSCGCGQLTLDRQRGFHGCAWQFRTLPTPNRRPCRSRVRHVRQSQR